MWLRQSGTHLNRFVISSKVEYSILFAHPGAFQFFWPCGCGAANPPIDDFGPAVVFDAAFDGEQGVRFGLRPPPSRPTKNKGCVHRQDLLSEVPDRVECLRAARSLRLLFLENLVKRLSETIACRSATVPSPALDSARFDPICIPAMALAWYRRCRCPLRAALLKTMPGLFAAGRRPCVKFGSTLGCIPYFSVRRLQSGNPFNC